jgi:hypothetical protein
MFAAVADRCAGIGDEMVGMLDAIRISLLQPVGSVRRRSDTNSLDHPVPD